MTLKEKVSPQELERLLNQHNGDCKTIGEILGCSSSQVVSLCNKYFKKGIRQIISELKASKIEGAIAGGKTNALDISESTGFSQGQVLKYLKSQNKTSTPRHVYPEGRKIYDWLILDSQAYERTSGKNFVPAKPKSTYRFSKCQCTLCGETYFVARQNLVKSLTKSCHKCSYGKRKKSIKIRNVTTGVEYPNILAAAESVEINSCIFASRLRRGRSIKGMMFEVIGKDTKN